MTDRVVLRAMCKRKKHALATVTAAAAGLLVDVVLAVQSGPGNHFKLLRRTFALDGPAGAPEVWSTQVGCPCGSAFYLSSDALRNAMTAHRRVLVLEPLPPF